MRRIKAEAIIFDMDGVITNTMPGHFRIWKEIFSDEGINVTREDIYKREGQKGIESLREIFFEYGKPFSEERAVYLLGQKEIRFKQGVKCRYILGSRLFLRRMRRKGFRLALVTGTSRHEVEKILPAYLLGMFDVTVCGCEVRKGKPHPEPYLTALKKLAVKPGDAVVIENAPFGVRSARSAGINCFAIATSLPKAHLHRANAVFDSFKDLAAGVSFQRS